MGERVNKSRAHRLFKMVKAARGLDWSDAAQREKVGRHLQLRADYSGPPSLPVSVVKWQTDG